MFLNRLIAHYQSEQLKEHAPLLKPAIEAVETLTARILDVLNGAGATLVTKEDEQKRQLDEYKKSFEDTRSLLQQRITYFEQAQAESEERIQQFIEDKKQTEQQIQSLHTRIQEIEQTAQDKQALVAEYRSKNDTLTSIVDEYKTAADENKNLRSENITLFRQLQDIERQVTILNQEATRQEELHIADLEHQKGVLSLEREKAVLEAERRYQEELQSFRDNYNQKILHLIDEKTSATPPAEADKEALAGKPAPKSRRKVKPEPEPVQTDDD